MKLLILPSPYLMSEPEAASLDRWVKKGGVVMAEAHLAGYNASTGRHSRTLPGCGLAEAWGLRETDSTSAYHLRTGTFSEMQEGQLQDSSMPEDVRKALADFAVAGGLFFPIQLSTGHMMWGAERYATLAGPEIQVEGWFQPSKPCLISKKIGSGALYYAATHVGQGAKKDANGLSRWIQKALDRAGIRRSAGLKGNGVTSVKVDLMTRHGVPAYLVVHNHSEKAQAIELDPLSDGVGIFSGMELALSNPIPSVIPAGFIDIFDLSGRQGSQPVVQPRYQANRIVKNSARWRC